MLSPTKAGRRTAVEFSLQEFSIENTGPSDEKVGDKRHGPVALVLLRRRCGNRTYHRHAHLMLTTQSRLRLKHPGSSFRDRWC